MESKGQIILYHAQDGKPDIDVLLSNNTVWLNPSQIAEMFSTDRTNVIKHVKNIYESGELQENGTCEVYSQVQYEGSRKVNRSTKFYNLDMIISIGYKVNVIRGVHFRQWATRILSEYMIKGFAIDDAKLSGEKKSYFEELHERVRGIRTSEKMFYEKIKDIFAYTSIDYQPNSDIAKKFFAIVQNMFHFAIHGKTASELIVSRANAEKPNMGVVNFKGDGVSREDVTIAKNYLTEMELKKLNLLSDQFLSFAELQSLEQRPMYMRTWGEKLIAFLQLNDKPILSNAGKVKSEVAKAYALSQYSRLQEIAKHQAEKLKQIIMKEGVESEEANEESPILGFDKFLKRALDYNPKEDKGSDK